MVPNFISKHFPLKYDSASLFTGVVVYGGIISVSYTVTRFVYNKWKEVKDNDD